nr:MAG TPA: hypothetical protein [Caudoviricetes sp.]
MRLSRMAITRCWTASVYQIIWRYKDDESRTYQ